MRYKMPKYIVRLLLLLICFLLLAYAAKIFLTDPSFYKYGHYRADAIAELAAGEPLFRGSAYCLTCHSERNADWPTGSHSKVQCEVCHGTNKEHPDDGKTLIPADTIKLCTLCHEALSARPASQPQIVLSEHPFPDEETPPCHNCHDPHSPGDEKVDAVVPDDSITQPSITSGELKIAPPAANRCAKCHGKLGEGIKRNPALAGLKSTVFIERMKMYLSGARENKIMAKFAKSLSDEETVELAIYYESLPVLPHKEQSEEQIE